MKENFPSLTRRDFFKIGGVSVLGLTMPQILRANNVEAKVKVTPRNGAETVIMIFLQGGPSQLDTFDVKEGKWTPGDFDIKTIKDNIRMPVGLMPKLSQRLDKYAIVRSMEAWEAEHARGTYYLQAGRIISPARLQEIPSVGSVIAHETLARRRDTDFLPPFVAMNMDTSSLVGPGLLPPTSSPMAMFTDAPPPFVLTGSEKETFERRRTLLTRLDRKWREEDTHRGRIFDDIHHYYESAYPLLRNEKAAPVFTLKPEDHTRYGATGLGDACVMARNMVEADAGAKFVFISHGSWDLHGGAYTKGAGQYKLCSDLDGALSNLLDDLYERKDAGGKPLIDKTFVVVMGEFGRTPGEPTMNGGRDHYRYAGIALFAGAGVKPKVLGATDNIGAHPTEPGWRLKRSIYPEDVLVTIYSQMGIDWTKKITNTPSGRSFEYIENISPSGLMDFSEISELFA